MARGTFRSDLYYRINVFSISLPPLRERGDEPVAGQRPRAAQRDGALYRRMAKYGISAG